MKHSAIILLFSLLALNAIAQPKLTLEKCKEMALAHNQNIKVAGLHSKAAASLKKSAFTQFLPNFNIEGAYTYFNKELQLLDEDLLFPVVSYTAIGSDGKVNSALLAKESIVINPATGMPVTDSNGNPVFKNYGWIPKDELSIGNKSIYMINSGFTQPIFAGGKIKETYKIAGYAEDAAKSKERLTVSEVLYKVETYYWQAVTVKEKVNLADKYVEMLHSLIKDLENYYNEGLITKNDLLKARVKENEAKLLQLKAQNGYSLAKMALFQQIGETYDAKSELQDSALLLTIDAGHPADLSFETRPELGMLKSGIKIARSGVNLMKSRYLPDIGLSAGYLMANPNPYNGFSKDFGGTFSVAVVCKVPVFHWGDKNHTLNAAKAEYEVSNLKMEEANELISLEVQQASYKLAEAVKTVETAEAALQQANENLNMAQAGFDEGTIKTSELLEAQTLWQQAQTSLIESKSEYMLNQTLLKKVTGQLNN